MGDDVIVFSDKHCDLSPKRSLEVDWQRWFRAAVWAGAKQAWGAERWLRVHPERVFLDPACTRPLPVPLPPPERARYHLVVTVHGVSAACYAMLGGTGSLALRTDIIGPDAHVDPFVIGDLDPQRPFVHVFDDATLGFVMSTLDTTPDFLRYLRAKEELFRSRTVFVAGEENLLAHYLTHIGADGEHVLEFDVDADVIVIDESWWEDFESSEERRSKFEHDQVSYAWDALIEQFAEHALAGTQYLTTEPALESSESILRFMAAESRLRRRLLAETLLEAIRTTLPEQRRIRVIPNQRDDEPMYVFVLFPWFDASPEDENRAVRRHFLEACLYVAKMKHPKALDIVGIATESGADFERRSEDAFYFDAREWSAEDEVRASTYQRDLGILVAEQAFSKHAVEYPLDEAARPEPPRLPKNPRNKPCPCGTGRKYNHCHGR